MRTLRYTFIILTMLLFFMVSVLAFSSITASDSIATVTGGSGTVADPLLIEVAGYSGLTPWLDSLLPFRGIPSIELSYTGEHFFVPGINDWFDGYQSIAAVLYILCWVGLVNVLGLLILRVFGKRLAIVRVQP